ncbi:phenylalanine--tRNA ligase subunit beta [Candidatus Uhrbacteria bacterium]|nr:phenylalanine--tRNA ligase subunit beta [Candidatus Uhrbacteria bacterium]
MNIMLSYNWIKEYVATKLSPEDFARKISLSGPAVERLHPQAAAFEKMVVGVIKEVRPHPNADKLRLAVTDLGGRVATIVCGGSNLSVGMKVAVALEGAMVRWHGQGEPVKLAPAEIRGVKSEGMICAAVEIGLADAFPHAEREVMDLSWCAARAGASLADALELNDTVFDIEVTTNRPDAFSAVGIAREAAAIMGAKFIYKEDVIPSLPKAAVVLQLTVKNAAPKLCSRYQAAVLDGVKVGPSPWWLKKRLRMSGIRSVNNIVDVTNYVLLEYGQPLHAFDYRKLGGAQIQVRTAAKDEKILALDGKSYDLAEGQLVIADATKPVAVAGVMGGEESAVHDDTTTIVLEAATFDPVSVRRTARALNLHSDSSLRFEKGLAPEATAAALARAVRLCQEVAGGRLAAKVCDVKVAPKKAPKLKLRPERAQALIGVEIPPAKMTAILKSLGFGVAGGKKALDVAVPFWRARDIEGERDLVEEIARIHGYHNLPSVIPAGEIPLAAHDPILRAEDRTRQFFKAAGYTELLSYSFVSKELLEKTGLDPASCLRLANPLSSDFEFMRPSLIPGALATVKINEGLFPDGQLFEVSNAYFPRQGDLPEERPNVLALAYGRAADESLFRQVKGALEAYCPMIGAGEVSLKRRAKSGLWHPGRTVGIAVGGTVFGTLGEIHPAILKAFGIDSQVAVLDFDLGALLKACDARPSYTPIPLYPPVRRDLAFVLDDRAEYAAVEAAVKAASPLLSETELFDVYKGKGVEAGKKSLALHLAFSNPEKTLTAEEADAELERIVLALGEKFKATIRK